MNAARSRLFRATVLSQARQSCRSSQRGSFTFGSRQQLQHRISRRTYAQQQPGPGASGGPDAKPPSISQFTGGLIATAVAIAAAGIYVLRGKPKEPGKNPVDARGTSNNPSDKPEDIPAVKDSSKKPTATLGAKNPNMSLDETAPKQSRINDTGKELNLSPDDRRRKSN